MSAEILSEPSTTKKNRNYKWLWRMVSLLIASAVIVFMLSLVEWSAFWDILSRLSPISLVGAFAVYLLLNFFRSLRYITLLDRDELPIQTVFPIALYHNFLVRVLPFKLGEVSYIVLMRNRLRVPVKEGVSSLFGSRLLELLLIVMVAAVSLLFSGGVMANQRGLALLLGAGSIVTGIIGFYYAGHLIRLATHLLRRILKAHIIEVLVQKLEALALEFDRMRQPQLFFKALFWSCFTYGSSFTVNLILLRAIGLKIDPATLVVLISLGMFATAFPFNISGFGAVELSWAFGLTTFAGYATGEATSIGLTLNGYQLICAAISGLIGYGLVSLWGKSKTYHD